MHITNNKNVDLNSVEVRIYLNGGERDIYFRSLGQFIVSLNLEAFITFMLLPCMRSNDKRIAAGAISEKYLCGLEIIQDIYCKWHPHFSRVTVEGVTAIERAASTEERVGMYFSGGVDSWYTFLKHKDEVTDLIFVHGFDIRLNDVPLREKASKKIHEAAAFFGKNVIEIETNVRSFLDEYVPWSGLGHGPALAAVGHLLSPTIHKIYIPASYTYADLFPSGCHPILDYLWGTESLQFIHDGCEASRVEKVAILSEYDIALQTLRVCWTNPNSAYNCGRCEKCMRTMINLEVNNALNRCKTFDQPLDIKHFLKLDMRSHNVHLFIRENLDAIEKNGGNEELARALRKVLNRPKWIDLTRKKMRKAVRQLVGQKMESVLN